MDKTLKLMLVSSSVLIFAVLIVGLGEAFGQSTLPTTNSTPIFVVQPQTSQQVQEVAAQTDNNTLIGIASLVVTTVVAPLIVKITRDKDKKTDEHAVKLHNENEFRLEATAEAVKEMNNSLKATDKGTVEFARIVQVLFKPFKEDSKLKAAYDKYTVNGTPVLQALDEYIVEYQADIIDYYNGDNEKNDRFDTCNDPIVQKLALVRNKSKK